MLALVERGHNLVNGLALQLGELSDERQNLVRLLLRGGLWRRLAVVLEGLAVYVPLRAFCAFWRWLPLSIASTSSPESIANRAHAAYLRA